jgi:hypothetical protein
MNIDNQHNWSHLLVLAIVLQMTCASALTGGSAAVSDNHERRVIPVRRLKPAVDAPSVPDRDLNGCSELPPDAVPAARYRPGCDDRERYPSPMCLLCSRQSGPILFDEGGSMLKQVDTSVLQMAPRWLPIATRANRRENDRDSQAARRCGCRQWRRWRHSHFRHSHFLPCEACAQSRGPQTYRRRAKEEVGSVPSQIRGGRSETQYVPGSEGKAGCESSEGTRCEGS